MAEVLLACIGVLLGWAALRAYRRSTFHVRRRIHHLVLRPELIVETWQAPTGELHIWSRDKRRLVVPPALAGLAHARLHEAAALAPLAGL